MVSSMGQLGTTYVNAMAKAASLIAQRSIASSAAYATATSDASVEADENVADAESAFSLSESRGLWHLSRRKEDAHLLL